MKITLEFLKNEGACHECVEWFKSQNNTELADVICALIADNELDWASWLLCHVFTRKQKIQYSVFAAEQVIHIFEEKFPKGDSPRKAIESAKAVLKQATKDTMDAAWAAAMAAAMAAASSVARADAMAASWAAWAARAASVAWAAMDASMKLKIILYGCSLLKIDTSKWERVKA